MTVLCPSHKVSTDIIIGMVDRFLEACEQEAGARVVKVLHGVVGVEVTEPLSLTQLLTLDLLINFVNSHKIVSYLSYHTGAAGGPGQCAGGVQGDARLGATLSCHTTPGEQGTESSQVISPIIVNWVISVHLDIVSKV